jgi:ectoine hydroxylase-related dioxygenase (phytanoyl-CoA dioxygenase family)
MSYEHVKLAERRAFDAEAYRSLYPDIARAVADGKLRDVWEHFDRSGRTEGRVWCKFDAAFYSRSYPRAVAEIVDGLAKTPLEHYIMYGRGRGYLPNAKAARPTNAAAPASPFGGLWIDGADAFDRIAGRLETGQITEQQAEQLTFFATNGYVILSSAIDASMIDAARADLDKAYNGGYERLKFDAPAVVPEHATWRPGMELHPAKALDIHHFSAAVRRLMFAPAITAFLGLIFESKALASQTLGFLRGSAQDSHQDSAYVVYTLPRQFAASWVALEDVSIGAGELFYYPGSHCLPDFIYSGQYKSVSEAQRMGGSREDVRAQARRHVQSLDDLAQRFGLTKQVFAAKQGDVLIWHSDLIHGGHRVSREITRKSIVTHYCPKRVAPLFSEQHAVTFYDQDGHLYTSSHYPGFGPSE